MPMGKGEWMATTLGDVCLRITDGSHWSPKAIGKGIPMASVKDMHENGLNIGTCKQISLDDYKALIKNDCKPLIGDILIAKDGSYLKHVFVWKKDIDIAILSSIAILRPNRNKVVPEYLAKYLLSPAVKSGLSGYVSGAALPRIILKDFINFKINIPSLGIQQKIASILSAYDNLIENNNRRIKILEEMAQAIYKEWFVNFRFPGHEKVKMVKSKLGMIPEGWEVKNLFDIAEVTYGSPFQSKLFTEERDGNKPVIRIRDILNNFTKTYTPESAVEKYIVQNGDILVGMDGDFHMGKWSDGEAYLNQRVARFRPLNNISSYFLFLALRAPIQHFNATIVGTTVAHLGDSHLKSINLLVPDERVLNITKELLDLIYNLEIELKLKNSNLRKTRDLLLPKLISGEIDVEKMDIRVNDVVAA